MSEEFPEDAFTRQGRACDRCRKRKIRCDKTSPCSNCRSAGFDCKVGNRAAKQKRSRVLISSQFEEKIDLIEKQLGRLNRLVESLVSNDSTQSAGVNIKSNNELVNPLVSHGMSSTKTPIVSPVAGKVNAKARSPKTRVGPSPQQITGTTTTPTDGQSSLKAHSTFAIDFAQDVVGSSQPTGQSRDEIGKLLDMLRNIEDASEDRQVPSRSLFPLVQDTASYSDEEHGMPSLRAAVRVLRHAEGEHNFVFRSLCHLLGPTSLSDLCLKVYFSSDYSDAEFIIVNAALNILSTDTLFQQQDADTYKEHNELILTCQTNLERALSKLSLYIKPSYDMALALVLGVYYAINTSNTSLAWVLVGAAYQCAQSLGFHSRPDNSNPIFEQPDKKQLLFCALFFFEKTLSVRLGRSSIIPNWDISTLCPEVPQIPECHAIIYVYQSVKLAGLAGQIYDQLYSHQALHLHESTRTHRALELSQELHRYCAEARDNNELWAKSTEDDRVIEQILFISACDEVLCLSMLTLIYRAVPPGPDSGTTFSLDCITSARCALESHQAFIRGFGMRGSSLVLSAYVSWTILFTPFIPFIVTFCHAIETRDQEDLIRMHTFLKSIECACQHSAAIAKQHHLFEVFYNVALRYNELTLPSSPMEEEQLQLRHQVDAKLSALGLEPHTTYLAGHPTENGAPVISSMNLGEGTVAHIPSADGNSWAQDSRLGRWFSFNQQMMGLLDADDWLL